MILNDFLGEKNEIKCIYGPAASGKTTIAILASLEIAKNNGKVFFLDVENSFSLDRVKQLCDDYEKILENIFVFKIKSFKNQQDKLKELCGLTNKTKLKLVVIDTLNYYYRTLVNSKPDLANGMLTSQLKLLKELTNNGVSVLVTNQVYANIKKNEIDLVGSKIVRRFSDCLIELEKDEKRKIKLLKPDKKECYFEIVEKGLDFI